MKHYVNSLAGHFDDLLVHREAELRVALVENRKEELAAEETGGEVQDFKDLAERELQSDLNTLDLARIEEYLTQVLAARHRLRAGIFGHCLECGQSIDLRRLEALPAAAFCLACQTASEEAPAVHCQTARI